MSLPSTFRVIRIWDPPGISSKNNEIYTCFQYLYLAPRDSQSEYSCDLGHLFVSKMTSKMNPKIIKIPTWVKLDFCNPSNAKRLFFTSQTPQNMTQNHLKNIPHNRFPKKNLFVRFQTSERTKVTPNAAKMTPDSHPKSPQNRQQMTPCDQQACPEDT